MVRFDYDNLIACRIKAKTGYTVPAILTAVSPVLIGLSVVFFMLHNSDEYNNGLTFLIFAFGVSGIGLLIFGGNALYRTYTLHKLVNTVISTGVFALASVKEVHIPYGEDLSDQVGIRYALTLSFECDGKQETVKSEYYFTFAQLNEYKEKGGVPLYYSPAKKEVIYVKKEVEGAAQVAATPSAPDESVDEADTGTGGKKAKKTEPIHIRELKSEVNVAAACVASNPELKKSLETLAEDIYCCEPVSLPEISRIDENIAVYVRSIREFADNGSFAGIPDLVHKVKVLLTERGEKYKMQK